MAIVVPDPDLVAIVANSLDDAVVARAGFWGTEAERAGELADLLQTALSYHEKHTETDCPVCGREAALGASWPEATATEVDRLRALARQCQEAEQGLARALRDARSLLAPPPAVPHEAQRGWARRGSLGTGLGCLVRRGDGRRRGGVG